MGNEYGIVANIVETDRFLRTGSKAWLIGGTGGEGWERFVWVGRTRGGRLVRKWVKTKRLSNFRCAWIPQHIKELAKGELYISGNQNEIKEVALAMQIFRDKLGRKK